jgi:arylformamidase
MNGVAVLVEIAGRRWRTAGPGHDISIALRFEGPQPNFYGTPPAAEQTLTAGSFVGDVRRGGSCNCSTYTLTPHCTGTHSECVGHVTEDRVSVRDAAGLHLSTALLVSVTPTSSTETRESSDPPPRPGDLLITQASLQAAAGSAALSDYQALIVRTLPNGSDKLHRQYDSSPSPPYFSAEAMRWIVAHGIQALVVDIPSLDRAEDEGRLTAHRLFWGLPPGARAVSAATRPQAVVTELAFVDNAIADGSYLLNLQVAPFASDAAPSRPILLPLVPD